MKPAVALAFGIASALALTTAQAQVYQWKDSTGRTVVSDTPPPGSAAKEARVLGSQQAVAKGEVKGDKPADKTADAPKTTAEKDLEFKKRQQDARDKADKEAKEQKNEKARKDYCENARRNLAALESKQPVTMLDDKGERQLIDNAQRQQEIERVRQNMAEACK